MNWLSSIFRRVIPAEQTVVYLRSHKSPVAHGEAEVSYDAWGTPYLTYDRGRRYPLCFEMVLRSDAKTNDLLYRTEWRHKSGPPVSFGEKPDTPFPQ